MMRAVLTHITLAIAAGLIGSLIGTLVTIAVIMPINLAQAGQSATTIGAAPLIMGVSLFLTVPCAILIGAPATWPLRDWAAQHRWRAGLLYAVLGGLSGAVIAKLLLPAGGIAALYGALFGAATGAAFVGMIAWYGRDAAGLNAS